MDRCICEQSSLGWMTGKELDMGSVFLESDSQTNSPFPFSVRRFSVAEYELIGQHGILDEDDNVELLEGWIVQKLTKNSEHEFVLAQLYRALARRLPQGFHVRNLSPLVTADSVPEPDLAICRGDIDDYREHHPRGEDVVLVIEVSDTTLHRDRRKSNMYALGGVNCYWIVNLPDACVEVYSHPTSTETIEFQNQVQLKPHDTATVALSDTATLSIPVNEFLKQAS